MHGFTHGHIFRRGFIWHGFFISFICEPIEKSNFWPQQIVNHSLLANAPLVTAQKKSKRIRVVILLSFFQPTNCFNAHHRTRPVICCHPVASYMLQMVLECVQLKEFIVGLSGCSTSQPRTIWRGTCATAGYDAKATVKPVWPKTSGSVSILKCLIINIIPKEKRKSRPEISYGKTLLFYALLRNDIH